MDTNILFNHTASESLLDWNSLISQATQYLHFEENFEFYHSPIQYQKPSTLDKIHTKTQICLTHLDILKQALSQNFYLLPRESSYYQHIEKAQKGFLFNFKEINIIANLIEASQNLLKALPSDINNNIYTSQFITSHESKIIKTFLRSFRLLVSPNGEINFKGHSEISKLIENVEKIEQTIKKELNQTSQKLSNKLQFLQHDLIDDRYVLAMRSDSYQFQYGTIISRSQSGNTLFIEPFEIKNLSNQRLLILSQIDEIIERLAHKFSHELMQISQVILNFKQYLLDLDLYSSTALFATLFKLSKPDFDGSSNLIKLKSFFHPLIKESIENSIEIAPEKLGLILSGPNTGGKSVLLKTICITYMLAYKGLYIPAKSSSLYPYEKIFFFSNDYQNLDEGISSFAGECLNYTNALSKLQEYKSLFIIDEIFNSTSSDEASALAFGLIQFIRKNSDAKIIISTHHHHLKALAHQSEDLLSAHMLFDESLSKPLYKLSVGTPGSSHAFAIFKNIIEQENYNAEYDMILQVAKEVLGSKQVNYEKLLSETSLKKQELQEEILKNRSLNDQLRNQKKSMQGLLELEKAESLEKFKLQVNKVLEKAKRLHLNSEIYRKKQFFNEVKEISNEVMALTPSKKSNIESANGNNNQISQIDELFINQRVLFSPSNKELVVQAINKRKNKALLQKGPIKVWANLSEIMYSTNASAGQQSRHLVINTPEVDETKVSSSYDCRGMRLDEFKTLVLQIFEYLANGTLPFVSIIHGHGDGVLKSWLRGELKKRKEFIWVSPQGNDGTTEIKLSEN